MKSGQKLIGTLLAIIVILLGVIVFLQLNPVKKLPITNGIDPSAETGDAAPDDADAPAAPVTENPIDDIVENVIAEDAAPPGPVEVKVSAIPRLFWGTWTRRPELCGQAGMDDSAFQIAARKLQFWESSADVKSVAIKNPMSVEVAATYTGEGETWEARSQFALSSAQQDLMVSEPGKPGMWYKRCPGS